MENSGSTYGLYRMPVSGGSRELIYSGANWHTNVDSSFVYLIDHNEGRRLLRIDLATRSIDKLTSFKVRKAFLLDGYIYGIPTSGGLFRISKAGSANVETLLASGDINSISAANGRVYFVDEDDHMLMYYQNGSIYSVLSNVGRAVAQGDYVYYTTASSGQVCKWNSISNDSILLCSDEARYFVVADEMIYFTNLSRGKHIYAISVDGDDYGVVCNKPAIEVNIVGDRLFFINIENNTSAKNDEYELWCVRTDGSDARPLSAWVNQHG